MKLTLFPHFANKAMLSGGSSIGSESISAREQLVTSSDESFDMAAVEKPSEKNKKQIKLIKLTHCS